MSTEQSCRSFTADPDHPGDALYCEHPGGDGHGGLHHAHVSGRTDTWGWADPAPADNGNGGES